jgi:PilZ domain
MAAAKKERRRHQRVLVPEGQTIRAEGTRPRLEGVVSIIGLGGMFIRTRDSQPCGTILKLKLKDSTFSFRVIGTVRHVAENGLGVEITGITPEDELKLKSLPLLSKR